MRKFAILTLLALVCCNNSTDTTFLKSYSVQHTEALAFCKSKNFNQHYYFLLDLSLHSGKDRFFVYDFKNKKVTDSKLVTHGSCDILEANVANWEKAKFSNTSDSHCSMKGKFSIGKRDFSNWGINVKYWLNGLENSNSSAVKRVVVLHSWNAVSDSEIYPKYSPLSWGCPAVSDAFMTQLDTKLQQSAQPVLLWIID